MYNFLMFSFVAYLAIFRYHLLSFLPTHQPVGCVSPNLKNVWNSALWVTALTIAGVVFAAIAWLYLLNTWIKGMSKYLKKKAVF